MQERRYSAKFTRIINLVPRVDRESKYLPESVRVNIALFISGKLDEGCQLRTILGELMLVQPIDGMSSRIIMG